MTDEKWLPIRGYEGIYEVSAGGAVRTVGRAFVRKNGVLFKVAPRTRKARIKNGYLVVDLASGGKCKTFLVHALVAAAFIGTRPDGNEIRHLDGDSLNNSVSNLVYGTVAENAADRIRHGTSLRGELNPRAKLSEKMVREIRHAVGSQATIARRYGVAQTLISQIKRRTIWKCVQEG